MANRSKKVVLSARVEPYLKVGIELAAVARNEKIVKLLENFIEVGLNDLQIDDPFIVTKTEKTSFMAVLKCIWTDDEILFKLRAGGLGVDFAGEELCFIYNNVLSEKYFHGDYSLYGDLNGLAKRFNWHPPAIQKVDLQKIKDEWLLINAYCQFLITNRPFYLDYEEYKAKVSAPIDHLDVPFK
ncbi:MULTISPECIES: hypothetical protein [Pseudomonas]|uniref:hypothetical protein n=1 Tax=Pseudomonas TaxID=286 RepID=UPI001E2D4AAD|nr:MULTISPECIES: hypothetical protein [Pseudomonas]MCE0943042.1 hypothetical protein [Pseudomonas asiatica]MCE0954457.1 hypothetical protein [Pseudomonas asiatica]MCE1063843.1 hypothetical protein [Pseudomonas asiatica]MCO7527366.1 hypothetical protein [Pseudomonas asiatica]